MAAARRSESAYVLALESPSRSEQHLAGGCQDSVDRDAGNRVHGTSNVHVADLSAVPLPRVSPQMTAYLMGYHVGGTLY